MKTDLQLIQDVRGGDKKAFEELIKRHERFILKVVVRMTRDINLAEDVVQESFIKAYRRLSLFEGRSSFRSWLYQIACNTTRNRFRQSHRETLVAEVKERGVADTSESHMMAMDIRGLLQTEIDKLPLRQRTALCLRIFDDLSFKEIADMMECPYDTAKANYRHALLKLKSRLESNVSLKTWTFNSVNVGSIFEMGSTQVEVDG